MKIIFEDESIIVCIKPRGIVSQEDAGGKESMVKLLSDYTGGEIYPLHRLDRDVAGIIVFAKTKTAAAFLSEEIREHKFNKEYIAVVHSKPQENSGEMRDLLFKDSRKNKSYVVKRERKGVKEAILEYELLETFMIEGDECSKVKIKLHTGRTHQIRVQFASRKMALLGDKKYGSRDNFDKIHLWSYSLSFKHPVTKENLNFKAEPKFDA